MPPSPRVKVPPVPFLQGRPYGRIVPQLRWRMFRPLSLPYFGFWKDIDLPRITLKIF
jgi:hypothetical protein